MAYPTVNMADDSTYFGNSGVGQASMSVSNATGFFLAGSDRLVLLGLYRPKAC